MFEIMIDTGGTFTDGVLIDEKQGLTVAKAETEPSDPARGILNLLLPQNNFLPSSSTLCNKAARACSASAAASVNIP